MDLMLQHVRAATRANHLANERLHASIYTLPAEDFDAPRASFFPSLAKTLNHILRIDLYYLHSLQGLGAEALHRFDTYVPAEDILSLRHRQREQDQGLIAFCNGLDEAGLKMMVDLCRTDRVDRELVHRVLAHLSMHQTHHRGQVHAMLSSTTVEPPQLDEFLLASDARVRTRDLEAAGWSEDFLLAQSPPYSG